MYSDILLKVRTKEEAQTLIDDIDILLSSLYEQDGAGFDSALKGKIRNWVRQSLESEWQNQTIERKEYLTELKEKVGGLKVVGLTLAFEPSSVSLDKFKNYLVQKVSEDIVLDLSCDPSILGGAKIAFKGEFRDFSLQRVFDEEVKSKRQEIIELIKAK